MKTFTAAIIIPSFNKSHLTNLCIDSIFKAVNENVFFKVFVVDNASQDDEFNKVKVLCDFLKKKFPTSIELIRNETNLGFSKAINQGVNLALSDNTTTHICLLNNDTVVTDYWLDDLTKYASNALVGPVCNSVGNEQIIKTDYTDFGFNGYTIQSINTFAKNWRQEHLGNTERSKMLGFFCVLGERSLFEKVGLLDESFGLGYYEDDDYCLRVNQTGLSQIIVRQSFVHHWGSASFKDLSEHTLSKLFSDNRKKFIKKHKVNPIDQGNAWFLAILHEYNWIRTKSDNFDVLLTWNNPLRKLPLKQELINKITQRILSKIASPFLRKVVSFLFHAIKHNHKKQAAKLILSKLYQRLIGGPILFTFWSFALKFSSQKTIFIFPIQKYFERKQRPQHLANEIAKAGYRVVWIEPEPNRSALKGRSISRIGKNIFKLNISEIDYSNFYNSSLPLKSANNVEETLLKIFSKSLLQESTAIFQSPFWYPIDFSIFKQTIYDCMDAHWAFGSATLEVNAIENEMFKKIGKVVATSTYLSEKIKKEYDIDSVVIRNGCNPHDFDNAATRKQNTNDPTIGYFGAVAEWFDVDLLIGVASRMPHCQFAIIGNTAHSTIRENNIPANIQLFGERPYSQLKELTSQWDVAIIPFKLNELILATNPVKLYEYYALGLPVVSTEIPEVLNCPVKAYTAKNVEEFAQKINLALNEKDPTLASDRIVYSKKQTWKLRAQDFIEQIETTPCF